MEELIILTQQEFQQMQQQLLNAQNQRPEQQTNLANNGASYVPIEKFNELVAKVDSMQKQLDEFIK